MEEKRETLFVGAEQVQIDIGVSRAKAYALIKELNQRLKKEYPQALIVAGKVNRIWYDQACLRGGKMRDY